MNMSQLERLEKKLDLILLNMGVSIPLELQHTDRTASSSFEAEVRALLSNNQKIAAIKLYREHTGVGLKEAKDAVEALALGSW